ncbi:MAG: M1 family metallopeptidase, partial [Thermomonas sp.]
MRRTLVTAIALALSAASFAASAQSVADVSRAANPPMVKATSQLPANVRPSHYAIEVTPHADKMTFDGKVKIDLQVLAPTSTIVLQAVNMTFANSSLVMTGGKGGKPMAAKVSVDAENQTATFTFDKPLAAGSYALTTDYTGVINTQANGFFALDYQTASGKQRALYTQFENSDARRFVPSWDEPNFKATFDLAVNAPAGQMVVSNMPVASAKTAGKDMQRVVFETSPKMSTYLLFLGMGDFDRTSIKGDNGTEIGVIAQKGKVDQAQFALEAGRDVLHEYNDYFGTNYPLPKLDNIAAPGRSQFFSAMENWGAIFTFEYSLLLDPSISTVSDQQRVFTTAAHEIAHQWFGDLVTMAWWDDL